jgi:hypothetical protein
MAKVTDIQDKNGVSREIQDKDLANRTSQSTVASTDYILLEDTDGAYHKIAKASFTEAVRGALGSVINSVAKGTDIAKIPVLDSSNDLGMGTLANVASVLGVRIYKINSDAQDSPWGPDYSAFIFRFTHSKGNYMEFAMKDQYGGSTELKYRSCRGEMLTAWRAI